MCVCVCVYFGDKWLLLCSGNLRSLAFGKAINYKVVNIELMDGRNN